jgi:hypothetical protein
MEKKLFIKKILGRMAPAGERFRIVRQENTSHKKRLAKELGYND